VTLLGIRVRQRLDIAWVRGIMRETLDAYRGVPALAEDAAVLATFDGPGRAARCALAIVERAAAASLDLSVGLHVAEIERRGAHVSGAGVAIAQAVADRAPNRRRRGPVTARTGRARRYWSVPSTLAPKRTLRPVPLQRLHRRNA
jgi:hypothetical protein